MTPLLREEALLAKAATLGVSQDELLVLTALNDVGDCGVFLDDLYPAVLLLSHVQRRSADEFYAPSRIVPVLTQPWTPELGLDALRRSVPAVGEPSDVIELARSPNRISAKGSGRISMDAAPLNPSDFLLVRNESRGAGTRDQPNVTATVRHGHV